MSAKMSFDEIVASMTAYGIPKHKAEREARRELGIEEAAEAVIAKGVVSLPFRLSIPWSMLVSDNNKAEPYLRWASGVPHAAMRLTPEYKAGKEKIRAEARKVVGDAAPLAIPLVFVGYVYRPSQHRNDASNFGKIVHDALEGVVVTNDGWFWKSTWIKVDAPDVDRPRAEIEIVAL